MAGLHTRWVQKVANAFQCRFQAVGWDQRGVVPSKRLCNCHVTGLQKHSKLLHGEEVYDASLLLLQLCRSKAQQESALMFIAQADSHTKAGEIVESVMSKELVSEASGGRELSAARERIVICYLTTPFVSLPIS